MTCLLILLGLVLVQAIGDAVPIEGQETNPAAELERTVTETVETAQKTQEQRDSWAAERADLQARYRNLKAQIAFLTERKETETERASALEADVEELSRRLEESSRLETGLEDTLRSVYREFEKLVDADLPFLPDERGLRLESLRRDLARPDIEVAEKLRRLLEALLVEVAYGSDFEVYSGVIPVGSDSLTVDILRLGRLSLFWLTPDGKQGGRFDPGTGNWSELGSSPRHQIALAVDMATRRRVQDIVSLPLGRVAP